jgi:hypothetical protein
VQHWWVLATATAAHACTGRGHDVERVQEILHSTRQAMHPRVQITHQSQTAPAPALLCACSSCSSTKQQQMMAVR